MFAMLYDVEILYAMRRYLVFIYPQYYPSGGANDLKAEFDEKEEAIEFLKHAIKNNDHYWAFGHVYDHQEKCKVFDIDDYE